MPTEQKSPTGEIYRIKVTLLGTSPPIWRRLLLPAEMTLAGLQNVPPDWLAPLPVGAPRNRCLSSRSIPGGRKSGSAVVFQ
jgi:hypothetical protein